MLRCVLSLRTFVVLVVLCCTTVAAHAERRVGLVIGNNSYPSLPPEAQLVKAVPDARAVRDMLVSKLKFDHVVYGENTTQRATQDLLTEFSRRLSPGDLAFVFFAGHGMNVRLANYLLPSDLPAIRDVTSEAQVRIEEEGMVERSLSEERVRDLITLAGARAAVIVIDACRNNIFREALARGGTRTRSLVNATQVQGARPVERAAVPGRTQFLSLYSASPGQKALDSLGDADRNANSPFTRVLVDQMPTPGVKVYELMRRLRAEVARLTASVGHDQVPAITDEALEEVVLVAGPSTGAAPSVAVAPPMASPLPRPPQPSPPGPAVVSPQPQNPPALDPPRPTQPQSRDLATSWVDWKLAMVRGQASVGPVVVTLSPDRGQVAVAYRDQSVRFWSLATAQQTGQLSTIVSQPSAMAFDASGTRLAIAGDRVDVVLTATRERLLSFQLDRERVTAIAFDERGTTLVLRDSRGSVRSFDLAGDRATERAATPDDAALLGTGRSRTSATSGGPTVFSSGGGVRVSRGARRSADALQLIAFPGSTWVAIAEDGQTFTGSSAALAGFELVKGRDRLPVTEDFIRAHFRPQGLLP